MRYRGKVKNLEEAINKTPQVGDVFYNLFDEQNYTWTGTEWSIITKDVNLKMTNYELNQQVMTQMKSLTEEQIFDKLNIIEDFFKNIKNKYLMLYCKELSYFTVFETNSTSKTAYNLFSEAVLDILRDLQELGDIKDIFNNDNGAIEIWITHFDKTSHCYYLFGYDAGIVPVKEG